MLKLLLYLSLCAFGAIGTFFNPLIGAIACIEAYLLNPNVVSTGYGEIRYQLILTAAFLLSCIIKRPMPNTALGKEGWIMGFLWLFIGIAFASCFWAVVSTEQGLNEWYELFKTVLILPFVLRVIRTERDMSAIIMACLIGILHASVLHVFGTRWGYVDAWRGREYGVFPEGQTAVLIIFLPLFFLLAVRGRGWERMIAIVAIPFVLDSLVSTYQRMGFVVLIVETIILLFLLPRRFLVTMLPAIVIVGSIVIFRLTPDNWWSWMSTIENPQQESSASSRFVINQASRQMLMDYPFGVGYRNYLDVSPRYLDARWLTEGKRSAHNSYYEIACELGIPGFAMWICAFGGTALVLRRIRKKMNAISPNRVELYAMALEVGLYGWFIGGLFHDLHNVDPIFWLVPFAVAMTRIPKKAKDEDSEDVTEDSALIR